MKPRNPLTAVILQLSREGVGTNQIARSLGCSSANVSQTLKRYGAHRLVVAARDPLPACTIVSPLHCCRSIIACN